MPNPHSKQADELTQVLRSALVEAGILIPTSPDEVRLVEAHGVCGPAREQVDHAFDQVLRLIDGLDAPVAFLSLDESVVASTDGGLAMAARNGSKLDESTREKIVRDVNNAVRNRLRS